MNNIKTVNINKKLHESLKKYCKEKDLKLNEFINEIIEEYLSVKDKSVLPLILKDNKGEIFEVITCNSLSPEIKNNMPKELSLLKNTSDGSGFIANYKQV